jgi:hypothetical protein
MMTDFLNKLAYNGEYGHFFYWIGVGSSALITLFILMALFGRALHCLVNKIAQFEVRRMHTLLVPKYFNDADFDRWLRTNNNFLGGAPLALIFAGEAATTLRRLESGISDMNAPDLYEHVLCLEDNEP